MYFIIWVKLKYNLCYFWDSRISFKSGLIHEFLYFMSKVKTYSFTKMQSKATTVDRNITPHKSNIQAPTMMEGTNGDNGTH